MLTELALPYADTSAAALQWSVSLPDTPPLDVLVLGDGPAVLELRLLGSSHCAVLRAPAGVDPLVETVACRLADDGEPVPQTRELQLGGLRYRFTSSVSSVDPHELRALAEQLRRDVRGRADRMAGVFPGATDALTVLGGAVESTAARWETWHLYPNTGEVVRTSTAVTW